MSGFTQLNYHADLTKALVKEFKQWMNNPYYVLNDKKHTITTYYNINTDESTFDPGLKVHYSDMANRQSSLRFNKINNFYLYGIGNAELNAAYGDYGLEAGEINGDAIVLPNTIIPYPNDFFSITYLDKDLLFKVTRVTPDTLPNGCNFYQIEYILDQHGWEEGTIEDKVIRSLTMKIQNFGSNNKIILSEEEVKYEDSISSIITRLQNYFNEIFYDGNIQSYSFTQDNALFYDGYMIEFIIRNGILKGEDFIYITHRTALSKYFNIEYEHTVFMAMETGRIDHLKQFNNPFVGIGVEEQTSLLSQHYETYYEMTYSKYHRLSAVASFYVLSTDLFTHITDNIHYDEENKLVYNILVDYFNGVTLVPSEVTKSIDKMDLGNDKETFYLLPFLIFILNKTLSASLESD